MKLAKMLGTWLLQVFLALMFVMIGIGKFQDRTWERNFARWGYPAGFHRVVGGAEVAAGALLLAPQVAAYAAASLGVVMIGAGVTHVIHQEHRRLTANVAYLALLTWVGWLRRRSAWRWRARADSAPSAEAMYKGA